MPLMSGALLLGGAIIGDEISAQGQQQTNAQGTANMMQQEQWQEQMSNTAMQRRVTDLKAAGLNPMLATGTNGAQVGSVGQPNLQNPDAAFGGVGSQLSTAATTAAQVENLQAQAEKSRADAAVTNAQLPYSGDTASAALDNLRTRTKEAWNNAAYIEQNYAAKGAELESLNRNNNFQEQWLTLRNDLQAVDLQRAKLGMPRLENDADWQKAHPNLSGWLQSGSVPAATGVVNSAARVGSMLP